MDPERDPAADDRDPAGEPERDPDAGERGVVDRVRDGVAVLLVGPRERELMLPARHLPAGIGEGSHVIVRDGPGAGGRDDDARADSDDDAVDVVVLEAEGAATDEARRRAAARTDRLRRERGGGRFGR